MRFNLLTDNKPNEYARWKSADGNYSIQRFVYRSPKHGGNAVPSDPYYSVYSIRDYSKNIGEAVNLNGAKNIANHHDIANYSEAT